MNSRRVLVTGGAGYIGSHTVVELINAGYEVVIVDNLSNSDRSSLEGIAKITGVEPLFIEADCCDMAAMERIFAEHDFQSVIHFAAYKAVGESVAEPLKYYHNNLTSLVNVLTLMQKYGRENILFSSSATVYGDAEVLPVTELTPRKPATSPYGNTKQMAEDILRDSVAANANLRGIALRYFNPIGAHPSALIGELPRGVPNNLVPFITQTAAGVRECLSIFGDDYPTPDGTCIRDYIDVVDLAQAHVAAISRLIEGKNKAKYEIFNVGTGNGTSVMELVKDCHVPQLSQDAYEGEDAFCSPAIIVSSTCFFNSSISVVFESSCCSSFLSVATSSFSTSLTFFSLIITSFIFY